MTKHSVVKVKKTLKTHRFPVAESNKTDGLIRLGDKIFCKKSKKTLKTHRLPVAESNKTDGLIRLGDKIFFDKFDKKCMFWAMKNALDENITVLDFQNSREVLIKNHKKKYQNDFGNQTGMWSINVAQHVMSTKEYETIRIKARKLKDRSIEQLLLKDNDAEILRAKLDASVRISLKPYFNQSVIATLRKFHKNKTGGIIIYYHCVCIRDNLIIDSHGTGNKAVISLDDFDLSDVDRMYYFKKM